MTNSPTTRLQIRFLPGPKLKKEPSLFGSGHCVQCGHFLLCEKGVCQRQDFDFPARIFKIDADVVRTADGAQHVLVGVGQVEAQIAAHELRLSVLTAGKGEGVRWLSEFSGEDLPELPASGDEAVAQSGCAKTHGALALVGGEQRGTTGKLSRREFKRSTPDRDHEA
jgi:hypothetical protein